MKWPEYQDLAFPLTKAPRSRSKARTWSHRTPRTEGTETHTHTAEFESPDPPAASPPGSCPRGGGHRGRASPSTRAGSHRRQVGASSFSPAVPPACHKQRARAVCIGHSRSVRGGRWAGRTTLTWGGGGGRNCIACKGQGFKSLTSTTTASQGADRPAFSFQRWFDRDGEGGQRRQKHGRQRARAQLRGPVERPGAEHHMSVVLVDIAARSWAMHS